MIVRDYEPGDSGRIREILEASLADYDLCASPDTVDRDLKDVRRSYVAGGGTFRVLCDRDGRVLGMYGLHNEGDRVAELRKMYLDPAEKGKGYGKLMLEDAIGVAKKLGFRQITLESNRLLIEAIGLYRSYGFTESRRDEFSDRCDLAMSLQL